jgi:hypothetical protein
MEMLSFTILPLGTQVSSQRAFSANHKEEVVLVHNHSFGVWNVLGGNHSKLVSESIESRLSYLTVGLKLTSTKKNKDNRPTKEEKGPNSGT